MARKKVSAPSSSAEPTVTETETSVATDVTATDAQQPQDPTACTECLRPLDWRDAAYAGTSGFCKQCRQRHMRSASRGVFHPSGTLEMRNKKLVFVPTRANRTQRRHGHAPSPSPVGMAPVTPKQGKPRTRAERRAATRAKVATTATLVAAVMAGEG